MSVQNDLRGFRAVHEWFLTKGVTLHAVTRDGVFFQEAAEKNHEFFAAFHYLKITQEPS